MRTALLLLALTLFEGGGASIRLRKPPGGAAGPLPCRFGLVLPRGVARPGAGPHWFLGRTACPGLDLEPVLAWPDGSPRWVRVTGRVELGRRSAGRLRVVFAEPGRDRARVAGPAVAVAREAGMVRVTTRGDRKRAAIVYALAAPGPGAPFSVEVGGLPFLGVGGGPSVVWRGEGAEDAAARETAAQVEEIGRIQRGSATVEIAYQARAGGTAAVQGRLTVRAGTPILEWEARIEGWAESSAVAGLGLRMAAPLNEIVYRHGRTGRLRRRRARTVRYVLHPTRGAELVIDGEFAAGEGHSLVSLGHQGRWLTLGASGRARHAGYTLVTKGEHVRLWLRRGIQDRSERRERFRAAIAWTTTPPRVGLVRAVDATARYGGAIPRPDAGRLDRIGGLGRWPPRDRGSRGGDDTYARTLALFLRELGRQEYRERDDLGDYRVPALGYANHEYDAILALVRAFVWTGQEAALEWARCAVRHHLDIDADWCRDGLPRMHGPEHDGGVEPGHTWVHGLFAFGLLTGDVEVVRAAERTAVSLAAFTASMKGGMRRERDYAWSLRALTCAAGLTARDDLVAARDRVAAELMRHVHRDGLVILEPTKNPSITRTTTFTGLGVVAPALAEYARASGDHRASALAATMARRYLAEAWDPEAETLAWTLRVDPLKGRVVGSRGQVAGGDLLFVAAGLAAVGEGAGGGWCRRQAERLEGLGLARFRRDGYGRHNGERVRVLNAIFELAARRR